MIEQVYRAADDRYERGMKYARCGRSGILLPRISLGMWQNFGETAPLQRSKEILHYALDHGVVSIDLANNYGPGYGTAEETFGYVMRKSLFPYRDELFIASKAGYDMWPGPYGNWGSRKYLMASIDQSLRRTGLEYFDVFYSHRFDPATPIEETLQALVDIVRQGKALYAGISRWPVEAAAEAFDYMRRRDVPCLIFQDRYNMLDRRVATDGILDAVGSAGSGFIAFSPLAEGLLTGRYLDGIPDGSRAARGSHLTAAKVTPEIIDKVRRLNEIACSRGQSMAQMALSWVLNDPSVTSVIVGCSCVEQFADNLRAADAPAFTPEELALISGIIKD